MPVIFQRNVITEDGRETHAHIDLEFHARSSIRQATTKSRYRRPNARDDTCQSRCATNRRGEPTISTDNSVGSTTTVSWRWFVTRFAILVLTVAIIGKAPISKLLSISR